MKASLSPSTGFIQELDESGIAFKNGSSKEKIIETDLPEENGTVEGMWMMYKDGTYYLFYSVSSFTLPTYRIMVARSDNLLGPYIKGDVPVVQTDWDRLATNLFE